MKTLRFLLISLLFFNSVLVSANNNYLDENGDNKKVVFRPWVGPVLILEAVSMPLWGLYPIPTPYNIPVLSCGLNCFFVPIPLTLGVIHTATFGFIAHDESEGYNMASEVLNIFKAADAAKYVDK